ncbi:helix-turn-helix domain-containing protein [Microbacterium sediminicola]|uniref:TetR/AcrR family transcriptional regulator n=1 Tax=Microbacterium sediminicola TaxID=415210 RepID=UPI0031D9DEA5
MTEERARARVGRPRRIRADADERPAPEQILDAAAVLFAERGYAATSTRQIAERAGMRQATLYYHFDGKSQILAALLDQTVRPTIDQLDRIRAIPDPEAALVALAELDVRTLLEAPHRLAVLYASPEIAGSEFAGFHADRALLRQAYVEAVARIGVVDDPAFIGRCCLQIVEAATELGATGEADDATPSRLAAVCLTLATSVAK